MCYITLEKQADTSTIWLAEEQSFGNEHFEHSYKGLRDEK